MELHLRLLSLESTNLVGDWADGAKDRLCTSEAYDCVYEVSNVF